jgi:hypothetical protein
MVEFDETSRRNLSDILRLLPPELDQEIHGIHAGNS